MAVGAFLHLARQRETPAWESLWAEDASVFLTAAHDDFWGTLLEQNGGYIHVVPRLIGGVSSFFPAADGAVAFAVAGSLVVSLVAAFVYAASSEVLRSRGLRLGLAGAVLLLPIAGSELYANALNLHFYLVFACFWALVWQRETTAALAGRSTVALAATLSDPVSALLLPLAVVGPLARRSIRALAVSACFASGLLVQLAIARGGEGPQRNWAFSLLDIPDIFALRVMGGLLVGDRFLDDAWLSLGRAFSAAATALLLAAIAALLVVSTRRAAAFALLSLTYSALFLGVHLVGRGTGGVDPQPGSFHLEGARYALLPFLFVLVALVTLVDGAPASWARRARPFVIAWLAALLAANYAVGPNSRSTGPVWREEVTDARRACVGARQTTVRVLASPAPPRVWYARISCSDP